MAKERLPLLFASDQDFADFMLLDTDLDEQHGT